LLEFVTNAVLVVWLKTILLYATYAKIVIIALH